MQNVRQCLKCGSDNVKVIDSRKKSICRKRKCIDCGYVYTTYEVSAEDMEKIEKFQKLLVLDGILRRHYS